MMSDICGHCGFKIESGDAGIRRYGFYRAHSEDRCTELMQMEITRLREEVEKHKRLIKTLSERIASDTAILERHKAVTKELADLIATCEAFIEEFKK